MCLNVAFGYKGLSIILRFWKLPRISFWSYKKITESKSKYILLFRNLWSPMIYQYAPKICSIFVVIQGEGFTAKISLDKI